MNNFLGTFNDSSAQSTFSQEDISKNGVVGAIGYIIPILFFLPILMNKNSSYCKFHANQQLTWLIFGVVFGVVSAVLNLIPVVGAVITIILGIFFLAVAICLAYGAFKGMALRLPFIGDLINIF